MRLISVAVISFVLFFPVYALMSGPFGNDWGAVAAMVVAFLVFPSIALNLWKSKPKDEILGAPAQGQHVGGKERRTH